MKKLRKKADDLFSEYIRKRDGVCLYGHTTGEKCSGVLQCSHIVSKGACSELRYNPNNAIALCYKHHIHGWHSTNPAPYIDWFMKTYPKRWEYVRDVYAGYKLKTGTNDAFKPDREYYEKIISHYKELLQQRFDAEY